MMDNLSKVEKFKNIQGLKVIDYMDKVDFGEAILDSIFNQGRIDVISHEGAGSDTMEYIARYWIKPAGITCDRIYETK